MFKARMRCGGPDVACSSKLLDVPQSLKLRTECVSQIIHFWRKNCVRINKASQSRVYLDWNMAVDASVNPEVFERVKSVLLPCMGSLISLVWITHE